MCLLEDVDDDDDDDDDDVEELVVVVVNVYEVDGCDPTME